MMGNTPMYHQSNQVPELPIPNNRLTLDSNLMKINLIKANKLYDEVGIYTTELKIVLNPLVSRTYVIIIHVLHPCKNVTRPDS
jgi:hypothetical protein